MERDTEVFRVVPGLVSPLTQLTRLGLTVDGPWFSSGKLEIRGLGSGVGVQDDEVAAVEAVDEPVIAEFLSSLVLSFCSSGVSS